MDNIILFLALFSLTATAAQVSLFRHWWQQLALAAVIAAITYSFYPIAISYSSTDIDTLLADSTAMLDMSVILTLEAVIMLVLALFMLKDIYVRLLMPWKLVPLLQYFPTASAVGVLCFYQVHLYQQGLEWDFDQTALIYGAAVALTVVILAWFIKLVVPLRVLRLELKLAMHGAQIVLAIAISILTASYPYRRSDIDSNLMELAAVSVVIAIGVIAGYVRYQNSVKKLLAQER